MELPSLSANDDDLQPPPEHSVSAPDFSDSPPIRVKCRTEIRNGGCLAGRRGRALASLQWDASLPEASDSEDPGGNVETCKRLADLRLRKAQRMFANGSNHRGRCSEYYFMDHFDTRMLGIIRAADEIYKASKDRSRAALISVMTSCFPEFPPPYKFNISPISQQLLADVPDFEWLHTKLNYVCMYEPRLDHTPFVALYKGDNEYTGYDISYLSSYALFTPAQLLTDKTGSVQSISSDGDGKASRTLSDDVSEGHLDADFAFDISGPESVIDCCESTSDSGRRDAVDGPTTRALNLAFGLVLRSVGAYSDLLWCTKQANPQCVLLGLIIDEILEGLAIKGYVAHYSTSSSTIAPEDDSDSDGGDQRSFDESSSQ